MLHTSQVSKIFTLGRMGIIDFASLTSFARQGLSYSSQHGGAFGRRKLLAAAAPRRRSEISVEFGIPVTIMIVGHK